MPIIDTATRSKHRGSDSHEGNARSNPEFSRSRDPIPKAIHLIRQCDRSFACTGAFAALLLCGVSVFGQTPQQHVHSMSHSVMPFDVSKSLHIFKMTESGGVQRVIARDPAAADQITLIQQHLMHEAEKFRQGEYSDPAMLDGASMPGLTELHAGAARIKITYAALPDGAELTFKTADLRLITAVHRWFGAQLSEHGADARAE